MRFLYNRRGFVNALCAESLQQILDLDWHISSVEKFGNRKLYHFEYNYSPDIILYIGQYRTFGFDLLSCKTTSEYACVSFGVRVKIAGVIREIGLRYSSDGDKIPHILHDSDGNWLYNRLCSRLAK